jgi:uncharacterized repeat protein (TIGR03803 family)
MHRAFGTGAIAAGVIATGIAAVSASASAATFSDLYSFCGQSGCSDGDYVSSPLVMDSAGHLFGTTALGGDAGWGTIFELLPSKGGYAFKRLHSFCAQTNCTDGSDPVSGLIIDSKGNLYGTTKFGGSQNGGTAFRFERRSGLLTVLHSFCAQGGPCADGANPLYDGLTYAGAESGSPYDGKSPLFGTTIYGGENNGGFAGVAYELTPGKTWKEKVIYQFCAAANCADGSQPYDGLVSDASGNLFGVTFGGGNDNAGGVVFELSPKKKGFGETVLYDFCGKTNCTDGANPKSPLAFDASGDLVGSTTGGGAHADGALFKLVPNGSQYSVLYNFCSQGGCADGNNPIGRLALDASGNLYGTTVAGGDPSVSRGVLYQLSGSSLTVLHTFCPGGNCNDGAFPVGGVVIDPAGAVFGTTSEGGTANDGVAFEWKP